MHPNRLAIAALSFAIAMPRAWATDAALAKDFDPHRMGWLPSDAHDAGEGLPDPGVNAVAVLPDGQAWIGTMRGLVRQNGPRMLDEHGPDGALDGAILDLAVTRDGDLLVATEGRGIWRRRAGAWTPLGNPFGEGRVQRLRVFDAGDAQRVYALGAGVAELAGDRWATLALPDVLRGREPFDVALDPAREGQGETLWIASRGPGLHRCDDALACEAVPIPAPAPRSDGIRGVQVPQAWWRTPGARALQVLAGLALLWGLLKLRERDLVQREERLRTMVRERTAQLQKRESELRLANDELRRLSYTDPLTGLGNRRRLFETLELLWRDAARRRETLALLLIDLDHFKHFNDTHGHLAGDARLQQVARLVKASLPSAASAARYGGEELCVLLAGHDQAAAAQVAERLRQAIAGLPADTALPDIEDIAVTASIGVAVCVPGLEQRPDTLVARADQALYAAKAAGRNRVVVAAD